MPLSGLFEIAGQALIEPLFYRDARENWDHGWSGITSNICVSGALVSLASGGIGQRLNATPKLMATAYAIFGVLLLIAAVMEWTMLLRGVRSRLHAMPTKLTERLGWVAPTVALGIWGGAIFTKGQDPATAVLVGLGTMLAIALGVKVARMINARALSPVKMPNRSPLYDPAKQRPLNDR